MPLTWVIVVAMIAIVAMVVVVAMVAVVACEVNIVVVVLHTQTNN